MSEKTAANEPTQVFPQKPTEPTPLLDRFNEAWRQGKNPDPGDFLPGPEGPGRRQALLDLLLADLENRFESQQPVRVESYLERFEELHQDRAGLLDLLVREYQLRRRRQPELPFQEYVQRFGQLAEDLQERLSNLPTIEQPAVSAGLTVAPSLPQSAPLTPGSQSGEPAPPPSLPGFKIERELGRGGMGVVYLARQVRLNRVVALKMILAGSHAGAEERLRFLAEAEVIAAIEHPGIVRLYEFGTHEGSPWFALEYCPGGTLHRKLAGTPLPVRESASLVERIARGVQAAHDKKIIHRDLKPGNILLDAQNQPRVTDFGLARRVEGDSGLTQTGAVMGTPSYMPPEQAQGRKDLGPATDVYALGAILYECLTGRPPFKASTTYETISQVIENEPPPPHSLSPAVPRDIETICLKCLQKEAPRRYASAAELADDLGRYLAGEPIKARPIGSVERAVKWVRRRPGLAALAAGGVLALLGTSLGGLFFGLYQEQQAALVRKQSNTREEIDRLRLESQERTVTGRLALERNDQDKAETQFAEGQRALDQALALVGQAGPEEELRARIEEQAQALEHNRAELVRRRQMQPRIARLRQQRNEVLFSEINPAQTDRAANRAKVRRLAAAALAEFGVRAEQPPADSVQALQSEGKRLASDQERKQVAGWCYEVLLAWADAAALKEKGNSEESAREALHLLDVAAAVARAYSLAVPRAYHLRRARYLEQSGDKKSAKGEQKAAAAQRPSTALDHFLAALESYKQGKAALAFSACSLALREDPNHFWAQYLQALCQMRLRRWVEARASLTVCLGQRPEFFWARLMRGAVHAEWAAQLEQAHLADEAKSEFALAEADFALGVRQAREDQSGDALAAYVALTNRSVLRARQKRWREAADDLKSAIALRPKDVQAHVSLAEVYRLTEESKKAVEELGRAVGCRPEDGSLYHRRARLHLQRGDKAAARRDLEAAIERLSPETQPQLLAAALVELGELKKDSGEARSALEDFATALKIQQNFPTAHRQRAEALLKLGDYRNAAAALDVFLKTGKASSKHYLARGLIHSQLREHTEAVECYTAAVLLDKKNAEALTQRGWAYLQLTAPKAALADFERSLKLRPEHASTLSGRGQARVMLGSVAEAVRDGEKALALDSDGLQQLMVACIYARAAGLLAFETRSGRPRAGVSYEERAADLVCQAVLRNKEKERSAFWHKHVEPEPALAAVRRHPRVVRVLAAIKEK
jgi:Tfp pilus assembly protein PilF